MQEKQTPLILKLLMPPCEIISFSVWAFSAWLPQDFEPPLIFTTNDAWLFRLVSFLNPGSSMSLSTVFVEEFQYTSSSWTAFLVQVRRLPRASLHPYNMMVVSLKLSTFRRLNLKGFVSFWGCYQFFILHDMAIWLWAPSGHWSL